MTSQLRPLLLLALALVAGLYLLTALPLPYLLLDHDAGMAAGDCSHSAIDVHAWLEWAAGSSLLGDALVDTSALQPGTLVVIPPVWTSSFLFASALGSRGPPSTR